MLNSAVLAIRFRESRELENPVQYKELIESGVITGPIQSIQRVKQESLLWIKKRINLQ